MANTNSRPSLVFFGNEKLATGIEAPKPIVMQHLTHAGYKIEAHITEQTKTLPEFRSKIAVLVAHGQLLNNSVLRQFPLGVINVHPSLLPQYRGPSPIEQAILDGAAKTGVSIMKLTAAMDEGPLYKQKTVHLTGVESKAELAKQLQLLGAELLLAVLPSILAGSAKLRQQPHPDRATYSRKITKTDGQIDWHKPAIELEREIRAYLGWPGSFTTLAGKDAAITQASVINISGKPGTVFKHQGGFGVYAKIGGLLVQRIKPASKAEMGGQDFYNGYLKN